MQMIIVYVKIFSCFLVQISILLNYKTKKVAKSLLGLPNMPARTLNDFFAGFFYGLAREDLESGAKPLYSRSRNPQEGRMNDEYLRGKIIL